MVAYCHILEHVSGPALLAALVKRIFRWGCLQISDLATLAHIPGLSWFGYSMLFPTCQMRVVRFYVSYPASSSPPLPPAAPDGSELPTAASSRRHCSDLNGKPQWQWPHRTSTASPQQQCPPPDLNCELPMAVFPTGPQLVEFISDRVSEFMSDRASGSMSDRCQKFGQVEYQNLCPIR